MRHQNLTIVERYFSRIKRKSGITLVALVITIIVLLILAGISIAGLASNGLFGKTQKAKKVQDIAKVEEHIKMIIYDKNIEKSGKATLQDIIDGLDEDEKYEYEIMLGESSKIKGDKPTIGNIQSIIVVYNDLKYRITSDLNVTSLNTGEIIESNNSEKLNSEYVYINFDIKSKTGTSITVEIKEDYKDLIDSVKYYIDDELKYTGNILEYTYTGLKKATDYKISVKAKFKTNEIAIITKTSDMIKTGLTDYWKLNNNLTNEINNSHGDLQSINQVEYANGGAYLENNYLISNLTQNYQSNWTLICEYRPTSTYIDSAWIIGYPTSRNAHLGITYANNGIWPSFGPVINSSKLNVNEYNTIALVYNKSNVIYYINGEKLINGKIYNSGSTKLHIGRRTFKWTYNKWIL